MSIDEGSIQVEIDPDFAGFASTMQTRIMPLLESIQKQVGGIDLSVKALTQSMRALVAPTQAFAKAMNSVDAKQLAGTVQAAARIGEHLGEASAQAATFAESLNTVSSDDLKEVATAAKVTGNSLVKAAGGAEALNKALDAIDPKDLNQVAAAATAASVALGGTAASARGVDAAVNDVGKSSDKATGGVNNLGGSLHKLKTAAIAPAAVVAAITAIGAASIVAAVNFETAFTGVTKTVDGTEAQIASLRQGIIDMSQTLPATTTDIAAVAEAAGALGIATPNVLDFTKVMIDLGNTTDLTADQAATSFAQIANVIKLPQDKFDEMGSTLVALGNAGASTESQILELTNRIAASGAQVGLTTPQILGLASSLASLGVPSEAGGTAIQKTFFDIDKAVRQGGVELEIFAKTAGVSSAEFKRVFEEDALKALQIFTAGLGKVKESGGSAASVLESLGITEQRQILTLLKLSEGTAVLARDQVTANEAWEKNNALTDEATKRYGTVESQLKVLGNTVVESARQLGEKLVPSLLDTAQSLSKSVLPALIAGTESAFPVLAEVVTQLGTAFSPLLEALGKVVALAGKILLPQLKLLTPILQIVGKLVGFVAEAFGLVVDAVVELVMKIPGITALFEKLGDIMDFVNGGSTDFAEAQKRSAAAVKEIVTSLGGYEGTVKALGEGFNEFITTESAWAKDPAVLNKLTKSKVGLEELRKQLIGGDNGFEDFVASQMRAGQIQEFYVNGVKKTADEIDNYTGSLHKAAIEGQLNAGASNDVIQAYLDTARALEQSSAAAIQAALADESLTQAQYDAAAAAVLATNGFVNQDLVLQQLARQGLLTAESSQVAIQQAQQATVAGADAFNFLALGIGNLRGKSEEQLKQLGTDLGLNGEQFATWVEDVKESIDDLVKAAVTNLPKISDAFAGKDGKAALDTQGITKKLKETQQNIQGFQADLTTLQGKGFGVLAAELLRQGPLVAGALAHQLAIGWDGMAAQLQEQLVATENTIGSFSAWIANEFGPMLSVASGEAAALAAAAFGKTLEEDGTFEGEKAAKAMVQAAADEAAEVAYGAFERAGRLAQQGFIDAMSNPRGEIQYAPPKFDFTDFTPFANGTIATKPTIGLFGEAGPEAVIPLSRPARARQLADESGLTSMLGGGGGDTYNVNVYPTYDASMTAEKAHEYGGIEGDAIVQRMAAVAAIRGA